MKKKKVIYLMLTSLLIAFVSASYSLAHYINNNNLKLETYGAMPYFRLADKSDIEDLNQTSMTTSVFKVNESTKFIFKIKYKDKEVRNMVSEKHFNESTVLNSKTKAELNYLFKGQGYVVSDMREHEVLFVNESDSFSYSANRYFIGIYNSLVTIYKTDNNGDITSQKIFNSNVFTADGKQLKYNFNAKDIGELQYVKIADLLDRDGLVVDLIKGRKHIKDDPSSQNVEVDEEYEKGEFKTPEKAFDYAMGLIKS